MSKLRTALWVLDAVIVCAFIIGPRYSYEIISYLYKKTVEKAQKEATSGTDTNS